MSLHRRTVRILATALFAVAPVDLAGFGSDASARELSQMSTTPIWSASITGLRGLSQTTWFAVLCGIAGLALVWFGVTWRIRSVSREIRARAEERADERIRMSRELHDTLLQGIQGLLLTFHVATQKLPPDDESKEMLENALSSADRIIIEGRNRVNSLRSEHLTDAELATSLENVGEDLRIDNEIDYRVSRSGIDATLFAHVADEVFYMAREALTNAFHHSGASRIRLELFYGHRYFRMSCKDNGSGFDTRTGVKPGHGGLKRMLERTQRLGGQFACRSKLLQGTEILFEMPSIRAYQNYSRLRSYLRAFQRRLP